MLLGVTQSLSNPLCNVPRVATLHDATTFQIFTRNPRSAKQRASLPYEIPAFNTELLRSGITQFVIHAPYCMNLATDDVQRRQFIIDTINSDIQQMSSMVGQKYYVLHPGSHMGSPHWQDNLLHTINGFAHNLSDPSIHICFETMAGSGTQLLSNLSELYWLMIKTFDIPNRGICFDTCHVYAAGLSMIKTFKDLEEYIKVIHLNNSYGSFGSRVDRHMPLKVGSIDFNDLVKITELGRELPITLETPIETMWEDLKDIQDK